MNTSPSLPGLRYLPIRGAIYMLGAVSSLSILDVAVKVLVDDHAYAVAQVGFIRYCIGVFVAAGIAWRAGGFQTLRTSRPLGHGLRAVLNLGTMITFYYALKLMPLADCFAVAYAAPLFVTALSVPLLKEKVGPRRWAAVLIGFAGVMFMLQPSGAGLSAGSLLALSSAFLYALTLITSRQLSSTERSHTILFYYSCVVIVVLGSFMPWQWETPTPEHWVLFIVSGVAGSFGQFFLNQAFRYAEASLIAPLDYTGMVWAILFGYWVWGDVPTWIVLAGATVVICSTLYIVRREALLRRQGVSQSPNPPPTPPEAA
ncbi:MAG TPA: DMT family transporter [Verrucomicrobiae bacterium]|nr:DMT family transporter [Verrucomicrobiae bacterium]